MDPDSLLPFSQEPSTGPYPDPDQSSHATPSYLYKIRFNIINPSMSRSS
jgi:hypothetical protein